MLRDKLLNYLDFSNPAQRLQDQFQIPSTHLSISSLELDPSLMVEHGKNSLEIIETINHKLENRKVRIDYADSSIKKLSLAEHIDNWRNFFQFNSESSEVDEFKENLIINDISQEDLFARLGYGVLNGDLPKRKFRIHFNDLRIPLSLCLRRKIHVVYLDLKSISREAFHFRVTAGQEVIIRNARNVQIHLSPSAFFMSTEEEICREIPTVRHISIKRKDCFSNKRLCSFELDLAKVNFSNSHIYIFDEPGIYYDYCFLRIPFKALSDSCLFTEAKEIENYLTNKIDNFEEELKCLLRA